MSDTNARTRRVSPKMIVAAVIGVLAIVFVFQNSKHGRVHFLFWNLSMPAWIWLLVMFVAGVVVGSVFPWLRTRSGRR